MKNEEWKELEIFPDVFKFIVFPQLSYIFNSLTLNSYIILSCPDGGVYCLINIVADLRVKKLVEKKNKSRVLMDFNIISSFVVAVAPFYDWINR